MIISLYLDDETAERLESVALKADKGQQECIRDLINDCYEYHNHMIELHNHMIEFIEGLDDGK